MIKEAVSVVLLILMFLGLVAVAYYIMLRVLNLGQNGKYTVVMFMGACETDPVDRLCSEYLRLELLGELQRGSVVAVDNGLDDAKRTKCDEFCRETKNVFICSPDELSALLVKIQKKS